MRIKIIDNDYGDVRQTQDRLTDLDVVTSVSCHLGYEATHIILSSYYEKDAKGFPDLVIMEAKLNGGPVTKLIRLVRECPGMAKIQILIYTGTDDKGALNDCMAAGASKVFPKGPGTAGLDALVTYVAKLAKH